MTPESVLQRRRWCSISGRASDTSPTASSPCPATSAAPGSAGFALSSTPRSKSRGVSPRPTISSTWRRTTRPRSRTSAGCARPWTSIPELWAFAQDSSVVDLIADLLGPDHPLPQLEAQLQVVRRRRRRALASGHPGLAAHELQRADLRRLPRRHRPRAGPADRAARLAPRTDLRPVRRRRTLDRRAHRARHRDPARRPRPSTCAGRRAPSCCSTAASCTARPPTTRRGCARCCSTCTRPPTRCR